MEHITLFTDILPEEQERMRVCFKVREAVFITAQKKCKVWKIFLFCCICNSFYPHNLLYFYQS